MQSAENHYEEVLEAETACLMSLLEDETYYGAHYQQWPFRL